MKGSSALLFTLAMTGGLLALVVGLRGRSAWMVAQHWREQLSSVSDRQAPVLLGRVAGLGEPGIPVLVEALGSERESVARAGRQVLAEQLSRWQMLRTEDGFGKEAALAEALASRVEQFGPIARGDAADLATQILLWLPDSKTVDRSRVVSSCERVLRAIAAAGGLPAESGLAWRPASPVEGTEQVRSRSPGAEDRVPAGALLAELSRLPGGGLRPELPSSQTEASQLAGVTTERPRRLPGPPVRQVADVPQPPGRLSIDSGKVRAMRESTPIGSLRPPAPDGASPPARADELITTETVDLMRRLGAEDRSAAVEAEAELMRRGFKAVHLELARRLFDPDPEVRAQLVRLLPGVTSVDAVPWMLWLSRDTDPDVRLAAITLMATTGDPALLEKVERMAREDPSPRIQRQAERIAGRRGGKRY